MVCMSVTFQRMQALAFGYASLRYFRLDRGSQTLVVQNQIDMTLEFCKIRRLFTLSIVSLTLGVILRVYLVGSMRDQTHDSWQLMPRYLICGARRGQSKNSFTLSCDEKIEMTQFWVSIYFVHCVRQWENVERKV